MERFDLLPQASPLAFPPSICHRITRRCNAACGFCQAPNNSRHHLTVADIATIAKGLSERGVRTMKLSGGEPTIRPDIAEAVTAIGENGLRPTVLTNGIFIGEDLIDASVASHAEFKVSIHRHTNKNDAVLRVNSFERILTNLKRLTKARIPYSIATVIEPGHASAVKPMTSFAIEHGARKISFIPVVPRGRASRRASYAFSDHELAESKKAIEEATQEFAGEIAVRIIDFRVHDYWIIENDGSLFVERWRDDLDVKLLDKRELIHLLTAPVVSDVKPHAPGLRPRSRPAAEETDKVSDISAAMMARCIALAKSAAASKNYAIGALVATGSDIIAESGSSLIVDDNDPSAHPEMVAIRAAAREVGSRYLRGMTLFTTLEPCPMCTSAAIWAKMDRIVFGAYLADALEWSANHPDNRYTWRMIEISAKDVAAAGKPSLEVRGGALRDECINLFQLPST